MKKSNFNFVWLFIAIFAFLCTRSAQAAKINVTVSNEEPNNKEHVPHRAPGQYSDVAYAVFDAETGYLSITFEVSDPAVSICIYKDGMLVHSTICGITANNSLSFSLSQPLQGQYRIVIVMAEEEEDLIGEFII